MIHREFRSVTAAAERDEDSFIVCMKKFQCEEEEEWMCKKTDYHQIFSQSYDLYYEKTKK